MKSETEAEEILASRVRSTQAVTILKPYYNAGSVTKTQAEDGIAIEDKFKLDYLAPFLTQTNVRTLSADQAKSAKDAQARRIRSGIRFPAPSTGTVQPVSAASSSRGQTSQIDSRSIDELIKFIEGSEEQAKPSKKRVQGNPKRREIGLDVKRVFGEEQVIVEIKLREQLADPAEALEHRNIRRHGDCCV